MSTLPDMNFYFGAIKLLTYHWLLVKGEFFTSVFKKGGAFNDFFSQQYQLISNDNILPLMPTYDTNNIFNNTSFNYDKIL